MRSTDPGHAPSNAVPTGTAFEIWPHRSLSPSGVVLVIGTAAVGVVFSVVTQAGPARLPLAIGGLVAVLSLGLAFWSNNRAARCHDTVEIGPDTIRVTRTPVRGVPRRDEFATYWVQVVVRKEGTVPNRILLRESGRSCSIGEFLSPGERVQLAAELTKSIDAARRLRS